MTVLVLALVASLALAITFAAKWQETRQDNADERKKWIAKVTRLESDKQILLEGGRHDADAILWYADELAAAKKEAEILRANFEQCRAGNAALQEKLSAILCPHNDHVWRDGVCVKCGRMKDAEVH